MTDQGDAGQTGAGSDAGNQNDTGDNNTDAGSSGEQTYSKSQVEHILQERLAAERKKLGDVGELKKKAAEFDKLQDAQKSELEKLNERASSLESRAQSLQDELRTERLTNAVFAQANGVGITDAGLAARLIDGSAVEFSDEGKPEKASVKKALEALVESHPILKGKASPGSADGGVRKPVSGGASINDQIRQMAGRR